jgi:hypothetical protein
MKFNNTSKKIAIIVGGLALVTGGAISAVAFESHAQVKSASRLQISSAANSPAGTGQHVKPVKPAAVGKVTAISGDTITLTGMNNTTYTVDATNATVQKISAPAVPVAQASGTPSTSSSTTAPAKSKPTITTISVSNIAVGDTLMVQGTVTGTNVTATKIVDSTFGAWGHGGSGMGQKSGQKPGVMGKVTAVNGNTITVSGMNNTTYTVDATNATVQKISAPVAATTGSTSSSTPPAKPTLTTISVSNIAVGDTIMVQGTVTGTNVTATKITDGTFFGRGGFNHRVSKSTSSSATSSVSSN